MAHSGPCTLRNGFTSLNLLICIYCPRWAPDAWNVWGRTQSSDRECSIKCKTSAKSKSLQFACQIAGYTLRVCKWHILPLPDVDLRRKNPPFARANCAFCQRMPCPPHPVHHNPTLPLPALPYLICHERVCPAPVDPEPTLPCSARAWTGQAKPHCLALQCLHRLPSQWQRQQVLHLSVNQHLFRKSWQEAFTQNAGATAVE